MFDPAQTFRSDYTRQPSTKLKGAISLNYCVDESAYLSQLLPLAQPEPGELESFHRISHSIIAALRADRRSTHLMDKLLQEYSLDVEEGVILMCLAEALLRIPDKETADALIKDKLAEGDWLKHLGHSHSAFVNAATWGLLLGKRYIDVGTEQGERPWSRLLQKLGVTTLRRALKKAMALMGEHFVLGQTIEDALQHTARSAGRRQCFSFDMLGEAALSQSDADLYLKSYQNAIYEVGRANQQEGIEKHSISIKLSALHPRYEERQRIRVLSELFERVLLIVKAAIANQVAITIDAEEQDRLELYLDLFAKLLGNKECREWGQLGLVIQAYSKRALPALIWLNALARENSTHIPIRLVKGAYWDSEIKLAQQQGMASYPVFTLKEAADLSYLVCARFLLSDESQHLLPQFASHNVNTLAGVRILADRYQRPIYKLEFQRLHGMGEVLHELNHSQTQGLVRTYAPIGAYAQLLPYLVRRLLENGANSSFVHNLTNDEIDQDDLVCHPYNSLKSLHDRTEREGKPLSSVVLPSPIRLYQPERDNSLGLNLNVAYQRDELLKSLSSFDNYYYQAHSLLAFTTQANGELKKVFCSFRKSDEIGEFALLEQKQVDEVFLHSQNAFEAWRKKPSEARACCLDRMADLLEENRSEIIYLCQMEAGKSISDSVDEVREAVDFCRYYAAEARRLFSAAQSLPGPAGEENYLSYSGRGVFVCISPWNFPVAIFTGQIAAALVSGNCVIAKPAESASLLAYYCTKLWYAAGVPRDVMQLVLGRSSALGDCLSKDVRIAGIAFTGSTAVARKINMNLANKPGAIVPFIAETGGQNAMIVDSTALAEQVVQDVVYSAFNSAGQRCSALRVLYLQDDIADRVIELLIGAMKELVIGSPRELETDLGPLIDLEAKQRLLAHIEYMSKVSKLLYRCQLDDNLEKENYLAPCVFEINHLSELDEENFGPILHLIRYDANKLDKVLQELNQCPYGLTLGIHSRNHSFVRTIEENVHVGNVYINRNQVGAVVGVQPFGGEKLSGTGPKAGGPNYLMRFVTEHTHCENTAAMGGNPQLLTGGS